MTTLSFLSRVRVPLLLLGMIEAAIVFSSVYMAALLMFGDLESFESQAGPLWWRAAIVSGVILVSLITRRDAILTAECGLIPLPEHGVAAVP